MNIWPDSKQYVMERSIPVQFPLILKHNIIDWGPKPFRYIDVWEPHIGFSEFPNKNWDNFDMQGNDI